MSENEFIRHLSENNSIDKVLESTANVVESIGRNSGGEHDNLTAAILEMNENSILKEKMNTKAKIIIVILSILLIASLALNVLSLFGRYPEKLTIKCDKTEITNMVTTPVGNGDASINK